MAEMQLPEMRHKEVWKCFAGPCHWCMPEECQGQTPDMVQGRRNPCPAAALALPEAALPRTVAAVSAGATLACPVPWRLPFKQYLAALKWKP
mmetsp:Transcript_28463/g.81502  ORF Transcript_28463/g.81502 Transcript_28463/m.81502 type:complete len:92 (+) Transcript_28463:481-756(+)